MQNTESGTNNYFDNILNPVFCILYSKSIVNCNPNLKSQI